MAMVMREGTAEQRALFNRLAEVCAAPGNWACTIQGGGDQLVVLLSEEDSERTVWESVGSPDGIFAEFRVWLRHRELHGPA
jgi:hypothetical protein